MEYAGQLLAGHDVAIRGRVVDIRGEFDAITQGHHDIAVHFYLVGGGRAALWGRGHGDHSVLSGDPDTCEGACNCWIIAEVQGAGKAVGSEAGDRVDICEKGCNRPRPRCVVAGAGPGGNSLTAVTDEQLVARTLAGDRDAFGAIVDHYRDRVFNVAYRTLGDRERADDAAQEAFVKAYTRLSTYRSDAKFSSWLFSITANLCIDMLRKRSFGAASLDDPDTTIEPAAGDESDPHTVGEQNAIQQLTHEALGRLPDVQRLVLVLIHLQGMSYEEAAEILGQPVGTVKSHAHRGRARLKQMLSPHMTELCT